MSGRTEAAYMLDTGTCAAILRRTDACDAGVVEQLTRLAVGEVCISAVTLAELMYGAEISRRTAQEQAALEVLLRHVTVVEFGSGAAEHYGRVRMILELSEVDAGPHLLMAAGHARSLGMTLVTRRAAAVGRVPGMRVVRWG